MITGRKWLGIAAAAGAVFCFAMAGSYCTGCTPAARGPIEAKLTSLLSDEQVVCLVAIHAPGPTDVHAAIVAACGIAPEATGAALWVLHEADALHIGDKADAGHD